MVLTAETDALVYVVPGVAAPGAAALQAWDSSLEVATEDRLRARVPVVLLAPGLPLGPQPVDVDLIPSDHADIPDERRDR
jgi:hypothetical protein